MTKACWAIWETSGRGSIHFVTSFHTLSLGSWRSSISSWNQNCPLFHDCWIAVEGSHLLGSTLLVSSNSCSTILSSSRKSVRWLSYFFTSFWSQSHGLLPIRQRGREQSNWNGMLLLHSQSKTARIPYLSLQLYWLSTYRGQECKTFLDIGCRQI
jgi:hypothetical protein